VNVTWELSGLVMAVEVLVLLKICIFAPLSSSELSNVGLGAYKMADSEDTEISIRLVLWIERHRISSMNYSRA
jgi:hypothetical protein